VKPPQSIPLAVPSTDTRIASVAACSCGWIITKELESDARDAADVHLLLHRGRGATVSITDRCRSRLRSWSPEDDKL
jgi:hypothetical protein